MHEFCRLVHVVTDLQVRQCRERRALIDHHGRERSLVLVSKLETVAYSRGLQPAAAARLRLCQCHCQWH